MVRDESWDGIEKLWHGHLPQRERNWLWMCLKYFPRYRPSQLNDYSAYGTPTAYPEPPFTEEGQHGEIYQLLARLDNVAIGALKAEKVFNNLADFSWIGNDTRQLRWLLDKIHLTLKFANPDARGRMGDRDYFICLVDVVAFPVHLKKQYLDQLRKAWLDNLKATSYLNWFDDEELERCEFAYQSLIARMSGCPGFGVDKFSSSNEIKAYFDFLQISLYEKKSHMDHVKKLWSQKVYRKRLEKEKVRQRNFVLPEATIKSLENVAKKTGLSRTKVLEHLIYFADKYGMPAEQSPPLNPGARVIPKREFQQPS